MSTGVTPKDDTVSNGMAIGVASALIVVVFFIYDFLWKSVKNETVGAVISFILICAFLYGGSMIFSGRALYIHLGGLLGTIMAMNVWMRIWPAQKKIIAGIKGTGPAPDASVPAMAGLRSKHNTYMSVPLDGLEPLSNNVRRKERLDLCRCDCVARLGPDEVALHEVGFPRGSGHRRQENILEL